MEVQQTESYDGTSKLQDVRKGTSAASLVFASAVILLIGTAIALWQYKRPYYWHEPRSISFGWFFHSLEWNIDSALPDVPRDLRAVAQSPNGACLWIAGRNGFLAYSSDQGRSWNELTYAVSADGPVGEFRASARGPFPCSGSVTKAAEFRGFSIVPTAYASEVSSKKPAQQTAPNPASQSVLPPANSAPKISPVTSPNNAVQQVNPQAQIRSAVLQIKPTTLDFRNVDLNSSSLLTLTITNPSNQGTAVHAPTFVNGKLQREVRVSPFSITRFTCTYLGPGNSCSVPVVFRPTVAGISTWVMVISSDTQKYSISLRGLGVAPTNATDTNPPPKPVPTTAPVPANPDLRMFSFAQGTASVYSSDGWRFDSTDNGATWKSVSIDSAYKKKALGTGQTSRGNREWSLSGRSVLFSTDAQQRTEISQLPPGAQGNSIAASASSPDLWIAGLGGTLFHSPDGHAWWPMTRESAAMLKGHPSLAVISSRFYKRFLPPWYFGLLIYCAALLMPALQQARATKKEEEKKSHGGSVEPNPKVSPDLNESIIGTQGISDKPLEPGEPDVLQLGKIAAGLSFFMRNNKTKPPLVISINGRWGSGKSSLMNLLQNKLKVGGAYPVWFNAWHHQNEEQLLAALLQSVKQQAVPPMFAFNGLRFRLNLFWKRIQKHWPYIGIAIAVVYLVVQAEIFLRASLQPPVDLWKVLNYLAHIDFSSAVTDDSAGPLGWIAGIVAGYQILSRLLTAFGSKPEALLSTVAGGAKNKDKEAQTSFRLRFAQEFQDVTTALPADQRMLILIDDLDRCRPEKVREVFEAVNFLVSSGDCFVVLGMARDIVEHYVGLSFRRVVEGLSWTALGLTEEDKERAYAKLYAASPQQAAGERQSADDDVVARRWAFARLYLDKLVQIEITVPEPTTLQKRMLFDTEETRSKVQKDKEEAFRKTMARLHWTGGVLQPVLKTAVIAILLITVGLALSRNFGNFARTANERIEQSAQKQLDEEKRQETERVEAAGNMKQIATGLSQIASNLASAGTASRPTQPPKGAAAQPGTSPTTAAATSESPARPEAPPTLSGPLLGPNMSRQSGWLGAWPFLILLMIAGGVFTYAFQVSPIPNAQDSTKFSNALADWFPLVLTTGAKNTPRAAKRFQNRVRYLAMRQRALGQDEVTSLGERWLRERMGVPQVTAEHLVDIESPLMPADLNEIKKAKQITDSGLAGETEHWKLNPGKAPEPKANNSRSPQEFAACIMGRVRIPEPLLVAFAAIEEFEPTWISDEKEFEWVADMTKRRERVVLNEAPSDIDTSRREILRKAQERANWSRWFNLPLYRYAYLQLCSEVSRKETEPKAHKARA